MLRVTIGDRSLFFFFFSPFSSPRGSAFFNKKPLRPRPSFEHSSLPRYASRIPRSIRQALAIITKTPKTMVIFSLFPVSAGVVRRLFLSRPLSAKGWKIQFSMVLTRFGSRRIKYCEVTRGDLIYIIWEATFYN